MSQAVTDPRLLAHLSAHPEDIAAVQSLTAQAVPVGSILALIESLGALFGPLAKRILDRLRAGHKLPAPPPPPPELEPEPTPVTPSSKRAKGESALSGA